MSKLKVTFANDKVKQYFMKLCHMAPKTTVDWKKFRKLDKKGIFNDFSNEQLSMRFRKFFAKENGVCWYCTNKPATENNGTCKTCSEKVKECQHNYLQSVKEDKDA